MKNKLENIISGHSVNQDDADWLRAILYGCEKNVDAHGLMQVTIDQLAGECRCKRILMDEQDRQLEAKDKRIAELEAGLESVCAHIKISVPTGYEMSGAWAIANRALSNTEGEG